MKENNKYWTVDDANNTTSEMVDFSCLCVHIILHDGQIYKTYLFSSCISSIGNEIIGMQPSTV